jgi:hypothetical protein
MHDFQVLLEHLSLYHSGNPKLRVGALNFWIVISCMCTVHQKPRSRRVLNALLQIMSAATLF